MKELKKGDKVKVIDDSIFPDNIYLNRTGYVVEKELSRKGITRIAFYPSGKRFDFELLNSTEIEDYLIIC